MSARALLYVSTLRGLTAHQRLVAYELAAFHNESTGQCNVTPDKLAQRTKLSGAQVARHLNELAQKSIIDRAGRNWLWPDLKPTEADLVPENWWPSEETIQAIHEDYPQHHFEIGEFVDDFIQFTRKNQIRIPQSRIDRAFARNISTLLDLRRPGTVSLSSEAGRGKETSVFDFLSRLGR